MRRVLVLICAAAAVLLATVSPASAAGGWTVQYPPYPAGSINSSLNGVSCATASTCIAVGSYYVSASNTNFSLADKWNGSSWVLQTTPNPSGSVLTQFSAVSCPATTHCEAVGSYSTNIQSDGTTLAERWNGTAWAIQSTPTLTGGGSLDGVSCPSASLCIAVGNFNNSGDNLAEEWNGTAWSKQTVPAGSDTLSSVSCPSATYCVAVGATYVDKPYALIWNGSTWKSVSVPAPAGELSGLAAVSCFSASACTATGSGLASGGQNNLVERWNGTKWVIQTAPNQGDSSQLTAVSCPSATSCTAIGNTGGARGATLAEGWNGSTWTIETTPAPNGFSAPEAISCTAVTTCISTGEYFPNDGGTTDSLAYQLN
jgi:hypothetical protein